MLSGGNNVMLSFKSSHLWETLEMEVKVSAFSAFSFK